MNIKHLKKLLYLLQLEEYQTDRYRSWLEKHSIAHLEERKNKLHWTARTILTLLLSLPLSQIIKGEQAVRDANIVLKPFFKLIEKIIILAATVKIRSSPPSARIIVTGSYGKTTFKEMLTWVLEAKYSVFKTPGNINTAIGIAQEILNNFKRHHQIMVVEAGAYRKGEIREICGLIKPNLGVVTIIGWMHLQRFGKIENIRSAKLEIADFIEDKSKLYYPQNNHQFIDFEDTIVKISRYLLIPTPIIKERIKSFKTPNHRLTIKKVSGKVVLIDDTYNSNPLGFQKALEKLKDYPRYQKIIVTPGMIELGAKQFELNQGAAFEAAGIADLLVIVGRTNKSALLSGAQKIRKKKLRIILIDKNERFEDKINAFLRPPTVILLENDLPDHYF